MNYLKQVFVIFLIGAGVAGAAETFTDKHDFGNDGLLWDYGSQTWTENKSVTWIHTLSGFSSSNAVTKATLPGNASGADEWWANQTKNTFKGEQQTFKGQGLSFVKGTSNGFNTLPPKDMINSFTSDSAGFQSGQYYWKNSHNKHYLTNGTKGTKLGGGTSPIDDSKFPEFCDPKPIPPATVPAPSAVLLAGLGTAFVGLLRSRKRVYI